MHKPTILYLVFCLENLLESSLLILLQTATVYLSLSHCYTLTFVNTLFTNLYSFKEMLKCCKVQHYLCVCDRLINVQLRYSNIVLHLQ